MLNGYFPFAAVADDLAACDTGSPADSGRKRFEYADRSPPLCVRGIECAAPVCCIHALMKSFRGQAYVVGYGAAASPVVRGRAAAWHSCCTCCCNTLTSVRGEHAGLPLWRLLLMVSMAVIIVLEVKLVQRI